ncbi:hypothetical protein TNCV_2669061 [Trichonephila clavipes]|nr:hypothetical protein TNCV_2669061 [Trichonephila clavipes]
MAVVIDCARWSTEEIRALINNWRNEEIQQKFDGTVRDSAVRAPQQLDSALDRQPKTQGERIRGVRKKPPPPQDPGVERNSLKNINQRERSCCLLPHK